MYRDKQLKWSKKDKAPSESDGWSNSHSGHGHQGMFVQNYWYRSGDRWRAWKEKDIGPALLHILGLDAYSSSRKYKRDIPEGWE